MKTELYWPMLAMITWTMGVGGLAVSRRIHEIRAKRLQLRKLAKSRDISSELDDTQVMDNFNNLLQVPILFYAWCLVTLSLQLNNWLLLGGAWLYVGLRFWHTAIEVTHNRVLQRFIVWMASNAILACLWVGTSAYLMAQTVQDGGG